MTDYIFARQNGRDIPKEDKIFGITAAARKMMAERGKDSIILATIGSLLNDEGELIVLSSVVDVLHTLNPESFAGYRSRVARLMAASSSSGRAISSRIVASSSSGRSKS